MDLELEYRRWEGVHLFHCYDTPLLQRCRKPNNVIFESSPCVSWANVTLFSKYVRIVQPNMYQKNTKSTYRNTKIYF